MVDKSSKNKFRIKHFAKKYNIKKMMVFAYYFFTNGIIKKKYKFIIDKFSKMTKEKFGKWFDNLSIVLLANKSTVKTTIGMLPFYLNYDFKMVLLIELKILI